MSTPESKVKRKVTAILKGRGPKLWYFMPAMGGHGVAGVPDYIGTYYGQFFWIETKANGGKLTELQAATIGRIRLTGAWGIVVNEDNVDQLEHWFSVMEGLRGQ